MARREWTCLILVQSFLVFAFSSSCLATTDCLGLYQQISQSPAAVPLDIASEQMPLSKAKHSGLRQEVSPFIAAAKAHPQTTSGVTIPGPDLRSILAPHAIGDANARIGAAVKATTSKLWDPNAPGRPKIGPHARSAALVTSVGPILVATLNAWIDNGGRPSAAQILKSASDNVWVFGVTCGVACGIFARSYSAELRRWLLKETPKAPSLLSKTPAMKLFEEMQYRANKPGKFELIQEKASDDKHYRFLLVQDLDGRDQFHLLSLNETERKRAESIDPSGKKAEDKSQPKQNKNVKRSKTSDDTAQKGQGRTLWKPQEEPLLFPIADDVENFIHSSDTKLQAFSETGSTSRVDWTSEAPAVHSALNYLLQASSWEQLQGTFGPSLGSLRIQDRDYATVALSPKHQLVFYWDPDKEVVVDVRMMKIGAHPLPIDQVFRERKHVPENAERKLRQSDRGRISPADKALLELATTGSSSKAPWKNEASSITQTLHALLASKDLPKLRQENPHKLYVVNLFGKPHQALRASARFHIVFEWDGTSQRATNIRVMHVIDIGKLRE